jgi:hypothetical protein
MPPGSFLFASALGALVLGFLTAAFGVWCGSRYGETEKRYIIQYVPVLACAGLLLYVDLHHHIFWSLGIFTVVYFSTTRVRSDSGQKRKTTKHIAK